jgi:hypothetical protein
MSAVIRRVVGVTASVLAAGFLIAACGSTPRSATNFCRQLEREMPEIAELPATPEAIDETVERYERLLDVAPLAIESDLQKLTDLFRAAADMDASNPDNVQAVVDQAYYTEQSAQNVSAYVLDTCGVDISTGLTVAPPATTPPVTTEE